MKRSTAKRFQDLIVWQKAHQLVLNVYQKARCLPKEELYGLAIQLKRAAVSVPANIAEGFKKKSKVDKLRYMNIAEGSLEECRYYLILAKDLNYANTEQLQIQLDEVGKLLTGYSKAIKTNIAQNL